MCIPKRYVEGLIPGTCDSVLGLCRCTQVGWGPSGGLSGKDAGVFERGGRFGDTYTEHGFIYVLWGVRTQRRWPCDHEADIGVVQPQAKGCQSHEKKEGVSPPGFRWSGAQLTPRFQTLSLQNCKECSVIVLSVCLVLLVPQPRKLE